MLDVQHLVQLAEIAPQQVVPGVAFFEVPPDALELVRQGEDRFGQALFLRIKALFDNAPGLNLEVFFRCLEQMHRSVLLHSRENVRKRPLEWSGRFHLDRHERGRELERFRDIVIAAPGKVGGEGGVAATGPPHRGAV